MSKRFDFRRPRLWEAALTAFALATPFVLPVLSGSNETLIRPAIAQEMQKIDTSRLVSIGGAVTEIVYALGEEKRLVGRDSTSTFPEQANAIPDVGYMRALSPEGVIALNPSAILSIEGSGPPEALAVLKNAGIPFETVPEGYDRAAIVKKIEIVGDVLGVPDKAKTLADKVGGELDAAMAETAGRPAGERKRVLFILSFQNGRIMAAGSHTAADGIFRLAGVTNATDDAFSGYKPLTDEAVIAAKPDIIMMMRRPGHDSADAELLAHPAVASTPAGANKAILRMDSLQLLGFGPRTASAIRELAANVYGTVGNVAQ
ncbi:ABC transporter substrate-binding protein [Rhizobium sp. TRM95111]|uniref:heme/hemin ABC transporter substrate-binding protein n=1 Tax=Rhizobium alarense TaxID=2846851 RepID=UPI001F1D169A|nr:ABC transporter substrate-binding protein [Rhizobium alarense]MCF3643116.1 ABC transporter substrate-binding protein [Rhizobium alarense]